LAVSDERDYCIEERIADSLPDISFFKLLVNTYVKYLMA